MVLQYNIQILRLGEWWKESELFAPSVQNSQNESSHNNLSKEPDLLAQ